MQSYEQLNYKKKKAFSLFSLYSLLSGKGKKKLILFLFPFSLQLREIIIITKNSLFFFPFQCNMSKQSNLERNTFWKIKSKVKRENRFGFVTIPDFITDSKCGMEYFLPYQ